MFVVHDLRPHDRLFDTAAHEHAVRDTPERATRREPRHCFEQARLTLTVAAGDHRASGIERELHVLVTPEVGQPEACESCHRAAPRRARVS